MSVGQKNRIEMGKLQVFGLLGIILVAFISASVMFPSVNKFIRPQKEDVKSFFVLRLLGH